MKNLRILVAAVLLLTAGFFVGHHFTRVHEPEDLKDQPIDQAEVVKEKTLLGPQIERLKKLSIPEDIKDITDGVLASLETISKTPTDAQDTDKVKTTKDNVENLIEDLEAQKKPLQDEIKTLETEIADANLATEVREQKREDLDDKNEELSTIEDILEVLKSVYKILETIFCLLTDCGGGDENPSGDSSGGDSPDITTPEAGNIVIATESTIGPDTALGTPVQGNDPQGAQLYIDGTKLRYVIGTQALDFDVSGLPEYIPATNKNWEVKDGDLLQFNYQNSNGEQINVQKQGDGTFKFVKDRAKS